jgi:hypothetical protein
MANASRSERWLSALEPFDTLRVNSARGCIEAKVSGIRYNAWPRYGSPLRFEPTRPALSLKMEKPSVEIPPSLTSR